MENTVMHYSVQMKNNKQCEEEEEEGKKKWRTPNQALHIQSMNKTWAAEQDGFALCLSVDIFFLLYTEKLFQAVGDNAQWETLWTVHFCSPHILQHTQSYS